MPGSARERLLLRTNHLFGCPFTRIPSRGECICPALDDVVAIEAEAVAAERARLRALVEGLPDASIWSEWTDAYEVFDYLVGRAAVLAALEEPDAR